MARRLEDLTAAHEAQPLPAGWQRHERRWRRRRSRLARKNQSKVSIKVVIDRDRGGDHQRDATQQRGPERGYRACADRRAEQDDGDLQQDPGAERHAGMPGILRRPDRADGHTQQDREHQRLEVGLSHDPDLDRLERGRQHGDQEAEENAGQQGNSEAHGGCGGRLGEHEANLCISVSSDQRIMACG